MERSCHGRAQRIAVQVGRCDRRERSDTTLLYVSPSRAWSIQIFLNHYAEIVNATREFESGERVNAGFVGHGRTQDVFPAELQLLSNER